jgi:ATP-dependent Clp protease ATP-binding subunit ClpA
MKACSVDLKVLKKNLSQYLDEELTSLVSETKEFDSTPTTAFQ